MKDVCQRLDWDSQFFGFTIARATSTRLTPESTAAILSWCETHGVNCLYFLAAANDATTVRLAEENGFRFVDIRMTLRRRLDGVSTSRIGKTVDDIRLSSVDDIPALCAIARTNHQDSRFYFDSNFPRQRCDALYETWIGKSCRGYAEAVMLAEVQDKVAGYISCHLSTQNQGQIGLSGIAADYRGRGLGQKLVNAALRWFVHQDVNQVDVVTQGRNHQAQRLYQRCGFLTQRLELWYHRWFAQSGV
jgi:dTDP-4-amino-4,6-dideoxy-D-galactose acyltransferase